MLKMTIGTFPEEDKAYNLVTILMWALPLSLVIASMLELGLFLLFNGRMHPWKDILNNDTEKIDTVEEEDSVEMKRVSGCQKRETLDTDNLSVVLIAVKVNLQET